MSALPSSLTHALALTDAADAAQQIEPATRRLADLAARALGGEWYIHVDPSVGLIMIAQDDQPRARKPCAS